MPTKLSNTRTMDVPRDSQTKEPSLASKTIQADAFDQFIEEQLKKERSKSDLFSDLVVCHAY